MTMDGSRSAKVGMKADQFHLRSDILGIFSDVIDENVAPHPLALLLHLPFPLECFPHRL